VDEPLAQATALPTTAEAPVLETAHARIFVRGPLSALPADCDLAFPLPSGARVVYAPREPTGDEACHDVAPDPFLRGNAFKPLHDSPSAQAALLSIAAARRVETGPESERIFVFLRGNGLVFLENGDTFPFSPEHAVVVAAGQPARVWAQGPDDALVVVIQPKAGMTARRTLAGEVARRRAQDHPGGA
jgi:hypothetical protein